jgi:hypothetical protein
MDRWTPPTSTTQPRAARTAGVSGFTGAALLGLIPYPSDPEERELLKDALRCVEVHAPEVARALGERMRAHYLREAEGGAHHGA